jgi:hypothetical protein
MAPQTQSINQVDPGWAWQAWEPNAKNPWNLKWAGHLYRRAGFGASLTELRQAESKGLKPTLELLLNGQPQAASLTNFLHVEGAKIARRANSFELRAWWLYCMLNSGHPLREKLTLFWHNHFATSIFKVQRTVLMFNQNKLLRQNALGKFGTFLLEMSKDAAMLVWLDSNSNVKGAPNENYAREVMELFSLGVGNYTEKDIREGARAFTGWHTDGDTFEFNPKLHDEGDKTFFGKTGNLNGDDVVTILLKQPTCARFLVRKLYRNFVSELQDPPQALIEPLAEQLRKSDYDIAALVRTMLSSNLFFSDHAFRQRIKSPVEFVLGTVRSVAEGTIAQQVLVSKLEALGQSLFAPPNVKGWPGGQAWLNTSTILARQNFGQKLAMGSLWREPVLNRGDNPFVQVEEAVEPPQVIGPDGKPVERPAKPEEPAPEANVDPARLIRQSKVTDPVEVVRILVDAFMPGGIRESARAKLIAFVSQGKPTEKALERRVREAVHAIISMPDYQLA